MNRVFSVSMVALFLVLAAGCTQAATPAPASSAPRVSAPGGATWQEEWARTVAAAKQEGEVSIATSLGGGVQRGIEEALKQRHGIDIAWDASSGGLITAKILAQQRAGLYTYDIVTAGVTNIRTLPPDVFQPMEPAFILPEVKDVNAWWDKKLPFYKDEGKILAYLGRVGVALMINTEMVKREEIKSWRNLLEPKWKGRILMEDPTPGGAGNAIMQALWDIMGLDFLRELAKQEPVINRDLRLQIEWVARGKYPVALGYKPEIMEEFRNTGAPVAPVVPAEGTYFGAGGGYIAFPVKPPHPNAARLFINWFLSKEGQVMYTNVATEGSRRIDIPPVLPPDRLPQPGVKYVFDDTDEALSKKDQIKTLAREIFAASFK